MYLKQFRHGFATNSSSSHSVILADTPQADDDADNFEYGWNNFILASDQAKRDYLFVQSRDSFLGTPEWDEFVALVSPSPDALIPERDSWRGQDALPGYVDHDSAGLVAASTLDGVRAVLEWLENPRITVLGGNDNEEYDFGIPGVTFDPWDLHNYRSRPEHGGTVYFNPRNGDKLHFFREQVNFDNYIATAPELVDIKLTDWCDLGCKFCYQDSTRKGLHAPYQVISRTLMDLSLNNVFEVALGGGEPMAHPDFARILDKCLELDIVPNFTTRNYKALSTPEFAAYADKCGSIGVSIATPADVAELMAVEDLITVDRRKLSLQVAMGAQSPEDFESMLALLAETNAFSGVILLGYKDVGRGHRAKGQRWYDDSRLDSAADPIAMFQKFAAGRRATQYPNRRYSMTLSMDTEMVRSTQEYLRRAGVNPVLFMKHEGRVSCYIDAVTLRIAPSSYCGEDKYRSYQYDLIEIWQPMAEAYLAETRVRP